MYERMWGGVLEASLLSTQYSMNVIVYDTTTGYWHQCGDSRFNPVYLLFGSEHYVSMNGLGRIIIPFLPGVWGTSLGDFGTCVSFLPLRGGIVRQHHSVDRQPTLHDFHPGYEAQHVGHEWGFGDSPLCLIESAALCESMCSCSPRGGGTKQKLGAITKKVKENPRLNSEFPQVRLLLQFLHAHNWLDTATVTGTPDQIGKALRDLVKQHVLVLDQGSWKVAEDPLQVSDPWMRSNATNPPHMPVVLTDIITRFTDGAGVEVACVEPPQLLAAAKEARGVGFVPTSEMDKYREELGGVHGPCM
eukprot:3834153-Amphidinium_carterae.1